MSCWSGSLGLFENSSWFDFEIIVFKVATVIITTANDNLAKATITAKESVTVTNDSWAKTTVATTIVIIGIDDS